MANKYDAFKYTEINDNVTNLEVSKLTDVLLYIFKLYSPEALELNGFRMRVRKGTIEIYHIREPEKKVVFLTNHTVRLDVPGVKTSDRNNYMRTHIRTMFDNGLLIRYDRVRGKIAHKMMSLNFDHVLLEAYRPLESTKYIISDGCKIDEVCDNTDYINEIEGQAECKLKSIQRQMELEKERKAEEERRKIEEEKRRLEELKRRRAEWANESRTLMIDIMENLGKPKPNRPMYSSTHDRIDPKKPVKPITQFTKSKKEPPLMTSASIFHSRLITMPNKVKGENNNE